MPDGNRPVAYSSTRFVAEAALLAASILCLSSASTQPGLQLWLDLVGAACLIGFLMVLHPEAL